MYTHTSSITNTVTKIRPSTTAVKPTAAPSESWVDTGMENIRSAKKLTQFKAWDGLSLMSMAARSNNYDLFHL